MHEQLNYICLTTVLAEIALHYLTPQDRHCFEYEATAKFHNVNYNIFDLHCQQDEMMAESIREKHVVFTHPLTNYAATSNDLLVYETHQHCV